MPKIPGSGGYFSDPWLLAKCYFFRRRSDVSRFIVDSWRVFGAAGAIRDKVETGEEPSRIAGTVCFGEHFLQSLL